VGILVLYAGEIVVFIILFTFVPRSEIGLKGVFRMILGGVAAGG